MAHPKSLSGIKRPFRMEISVDRILKQDLIATGKAWKVPPASVVYWLVRGLMADAKRETLVLQGDDASERLARWLMKKYPASSTPASRKSASSHIPRSEP